MEQNFVSSNEMDISTMCRLCFSRLQKPRNIFDTPGLLNEISKLVEIEINVKDDLPKEICDRCNGKLEIIEAFRRQIREADNKIKAFVAASRRKSLSNESRAVIADSSAESEESGGHIEDSKNSNYCDSPTSMLVQCYDILISQSRLVSSIETPEDFMLPSSYVNIPTDEIMEDNSVASVSVNDRLSQRENFIPGIWSADPLNLLKVKSVQPLWSSDFSSRDLRSVSSSSSFSYRKRRLRSTGFASSKIAKINPEITNNAVESFLSSSSSSSSSSLSLRSESIRTLSETLPNGNFLAENQIRREPGSMPSKANEKFVTKCPVCKKIFANIHGVRVHIGVIHRSENCQLCGAPMSTKAIFKNHMQLHLFPFNNERNNTDNPIQCHICKKIFKNKAGHISHLRSHTRSTLPVSRIRSVQKKPRSIFNNDMQLHLFPFSNERNNTDNPIQCHICKKMFKNKAGHLSHLRSHTRSTLPVSRIRSVRKNPRLIL